MPTDSSGAPMAEIAAKPKRDLSASPSTVGLISIVLSIISAFATHYLSGPASPSTPAVPFVQPAAVVPLPSLPRNPALTVRLITDPAADDAKPFASYAAHEGLPTLIVSTSDGSVVFATQVKFPAVGAK